MQNARDLLPEIGDGGADAAVDHTASQSFLNRIST